MLVIDSHVDSTPSLRIDKPFPALLERSLAIDFQNLDVTDHGHVPYVFILVRVLEEWKQSVSNLPPRLASCSVLIISIFIARWKPSPHSGREKRIQIHNPQHAQESRRREL